MASRDAAGWPLGRAYFRAILWDLQACITDPARIMYYCTRDIVGRLIFHIETARGKETIPAAVKGTGTAQQESSALDEDQDYNQQDDDDDDDSGSSGIDWDAEAASIDSGLGDIDYSLDLRDEATDRLRNQRISYSGDNMNIQLSYTASRYLVELLAVSPRSYFVGDLCASDSNHRSLYYCSPKREEFKRNLDSQGNLILHADGVALEDDFYMEINIPEDKDSGELEDVGMFMFSVDAHDCNRVMTQTLSTARGRRMVLTFIPMHTAIQVNVQVTLDLVSASGTTCYVDGEISAHHEFYNKERVVLFSTREEGQGRGC